MSEVRPLTSEHPKLSTIQDVFTVILDVIRSLSRLMVAVKDLDGGTP